MFVAVVAGSVTFFQWFIFRLSAREMDHWCRRPEAFLNISVEAWKELAIPRDPGGRYSHCTMRYPPDAGKWARVTPCVTWEFDMSEYGNTIVSEWSVVCERRQLKDLAQAANLTASTLWLLVVGPVADRIGRKTVALIAVTGLLLTLAASSLARDFQTFAVARVVVGPMSSSLVVLYVVLYEVTTASRRLLYCLFAPMLSSTFASAFGFLADLLKLNWSLSQLLLTLLASALLTTFYVLEETPAWLLATHRIREAQTVVARVAVVNDVPAADCRERLRKEIRRMELEQTFPSRGEAGLVSAATWYSRLRNRSTLIAFVWLIIGWTHSHYALDRGIPVSIYVRIVCCLVMVPLLLAVAPFMRGVQDVRRLLAISSLVFGASSALLLAAYPDVVTLLVPVLLVVMRLSAALPVPLIFYLTVSVYPVKARCMAACTGLAFNVVGDGVGHLAFSQLLRQREYAALGITSVLMVLAGVAAEFLPSEDAGAATGAATAVPAQQVGGKSRRTALRPPQTLSRDAVSSPAPPQRVPAKKRRKDDAPMPEQFAVRTNERQFGRYGLGKIR
ncbi:beta-alanine transporter-like [Haemaphysalis longicornis]